MNNWLNNRWMRRVTALLCLGGMMSTSAVLAVDGLEVLDSSYYSFRFAGQSDDGRYVSVIEDPSFTPDDYTGDIERMDTQTGVREGVPGISFELVGQAPADLHGDGNRQVWLQRDGNTDEIQLILYHYNTGNKVRLFPTLDLSDWRDPVFVNNDREIMMFEDRTINGIVSYVRSFGVLILDLDNGTSEVIEPFTPEIDPVGFYLARDVKVSADGSSLLFNMSDLFAAGDCCFSRNNYLVHYDRLSEESTVIVAPEEFPTVDLIDLSADGKTVVYTSIDQDTVFRYQMDSGARDEFPIAGRTVWLDLSDDASQVVLMQNNSAQADGGQFSDQRSSSYEFTIEGRGSDARLVPVLRLDSIVLLNLDTLDSSVLNKMTSSQLLDAQPIGFSSDGNRYLLNSTVKSSGTGFQQTRLLTAHSFDSPYEADTSVSGLWFDQALGGQGFSIQSSPDGSDNNGQLVVFWYTFDADGSPMWLIMQGFLDGNTLAGDAFRFVSDGFGPDALSGGTSSDLWGRLSFEFNSCQQATVSYDPVLPGYTSGTLNLSRLSFQNGVGCL